jgi:biopolymer transport protein ExbB/biopolymer transport protein TolQ
VIERLIGIAAVGPDWVLWLLLLMSLLSVATIIERFVFFRRRRLRVVPFSRALEAALRTGDLNAVRALLKSTPGPESVILVRALDWFEDGPDAMSEVLEMAIREQRLELEHGSTFLGTVGNNAPFVGLLGTVLGVVAAFQELGETSGTSMGSVMGGIAEALIATALGIGVALPAVVAYNLFTKRAYETEDNARALMSLILAHRKSLRFGRHAPAVAPAVASAVV